MWQWVAYKEEWITVLPAKINPTTEIISTDDHTITIKINNIKQVK